jgi:hypothetical protein
MTLFMSVSHGAHLILAEAVSGPYSRLDGRRHVAVEALNADGDERVGAQTRVCTLGLQGSKSLES